MLRLHQLRLTFLALLRLDKSVSVEDAVKEAELLQVATSMVVFVVLAKAVLELREIMLEGHKVVFAARLA